MEDFGHAPQKKKKVYILIYILMQNSLFSVHAGKNAH